MRLIFSSDSAILITQHKNNLVFNGPVPALVRVFCAARLKIRLNIVFRINHNHRPCRWFAQAPLGPITSRAYRLIEFSFYCMMRPTAIEIAAWRILLFTSLDYLPFLIAPYQLLSRLVPRFARIFFLGIAKAFWNHRHCRWFSLYKKNLETIAVPRFLYGKLHQLRYR